MFFLLASVGLMLSRLVGGRSLGRGRALENAQWGMILSLFGYTLFAASDSIFAFYSSGLIVGLGNGHMFPAMQTMFINLAENNRRGDGDAADGVGHGDRARYSSRRDSLGADRIQDGVLSRGDSQCRRGRVFLDSLQGALSGEEATIGKRRTGKKGGEAKEIEQPSNNRME